MSVAVWLTNYANEKHLATAIKSVLKQDYTDFTLYIFDNHSPGGAPAIIQEYADKDPRVVVPEIPKGLAGIPLMNFAWEYLNGLSADYSITLGGHDAWPSERHLEILVNHAEHHKHLGGTPALVYTDTWQVNELDQIIGRFQNFWQQGGQTIRPLIPQTVITTVDSPQLFGLWNEAVRKQVPIRHLCAGWDHLVVMHAALYGQILYEPNTALIMRAPPPGDGLHMYAKRHFSAEAQAGKDQDFYNQIEWLVHCVEEACQDAPGFARVALTVSAFCSYLILRGYNLDIFAGGLQAFNANPKVQATFRAIVDVHRAVTALTDPPPAPSP